MRNSALLFGLLALAVVLALLALEPWGEGYPASEGGIRRLATPPPPSERTPVAVAEEPEAIGGSSIARTPLSLPLEDLEGSWGRWNRFVVRDSDDRAIRAARVCLLGDGEVFAITDREGIVIPPGRNLAEGAFVLAPGFTPKHIGPTLLAKMKRGGVSLVRDTDLEVEVGRGMPYRPEAGWQVRRTVLRSLTESVRREFDEIYGEPLTTDHTGRVTIAGALFTHRSGRFTARLELDHPRFGTWTVQPRPRSGYEPIGRPPHLRIKIDRARPAPCVKIENGNRVPLSGVPVRVRHGAVERLRSTDPLGRLALRATRVFYEGKEAAASAELDVEVDLGSNRFWHDRIELAREPAVLLPVLTVDHRPVTGSIVPPPPPGYSVATAPETFPREDPNWIEPSDWELLFWQPVPPDGRFRIESGWQGPETIVYLRHDATGLAVDYDFADRVHGCFFQLEESCRVELACPTPGPLPDIPLTLRNLNTGRPVDWLGLGNDLEPISLASLPRVQELPRGEYELRVAAPGMVSASIPLEAEDRDLRVELPPVQRMRGIVRGELSGPSRGSRSSSPTAGGAPSARRRRIETARSRWRCWGKDRRSTPSSRRGPPNTSGSGTSPTASRSRGWSTSSSSAAKRSSDSGGARRSSRAPTSSAPCASSILGSSASSRSPSSGAMPEDR